MRLTEKGICQIRKDSNKNKQYEMEKKMETGTNRKSLGNIGNIN